MGASYSYPPPPLVEVTGPRSKIFVPAGSSFSFHPPADIRIPPFPPLPLHKHLYQYNHRGGRNRYSGGTGGPGGGRERGRRGGRARYNPSEYSDAVSSL
ncbi:uncharacterized protein BDR25DRAFT_299444, partial [Lindgomyces ingoldianus]